MKPPGDLSETRRAQCACGQLAVLCRGKPVKVSVCHCTACQRRTGAPFGVAAFFADEALSFTGDAGIYARTADNGHDVVHHFCPRCGSTVFWKPSRMPGLTAVATGAFADPAFDAPIQQVFVSSRHLWLELALPIR
jgi:Uncharacterized conserved protein